MSDWTGRDGVIYRWLPDGPYHIDRLESWFTDLAAEGLYPVGLGIARAALRRDAPRRVQYRCDVRTRLLTEDELALFAGCGWKMALRTELSYGLLQSIYLYFFETEEGAPVPEVHTDPMEQAESLRCLSRAAAKDLGVLLAAIGLEVLLVLRTFADPLRRFQALVNGYVHFSVVPLVWLVLAAFALSRWRTARRLRRRLAEGQPLDHHAPYRRRWRYGTMEVGWRAALIAVLAALSAANYLPVRGPVPLPPEETEPPLLRLEQLEGGPVEVRDETACDLRTATGMLVGRTYESAGTDRLIHLEIRWYEAPFRWEAPYVADGLLSKWNGGEELEVPAMDEAWLTEENGAQRLLVRTGRYVFQLSYTGAGELTNALEPLAAWAQAREASQ